MAFTSSQARATGSRLANPVRAAANRRTLCAVTTAPAAASSRRRRSTSSRYAWSGASRSRSIPRIAHLRGSSARHRGRARWIRDPPVETPTNHTSATIARLQTVILDRCADRLSRRYAIDELFKLRDRKDAEHVLALSHEEAVTYHLAREVRSYRELPMILYHVQIKERDEPRPRAGVLRTREFTMKDSYSFDRDEEGLERSYELHIQAYDRIFDRCGLRWYRVEADVGMMGGSGAHEYLAPCAAGENEVAIAPGYAANVEVASAEPQPVELPPALDSPREVPTPGLTTVDEVSGALGVPAGAALKAIPVVVEGRGMVLVMVRGDHRLNEIKLRNALGADFRQARTEEIEAELGPPGFIGPVEARVPVLKDAAIQGAGYYAGANKPDTHLIGVAPGRDFSF